MTLTLPLALPLPHTRHPEGAGLSECLRLAILDAGIAPTDVAYINAHGTSTAYNDKFETMAYKKARPTPP